MIRIAALHFIEIDKISPAIVYNHGSHGIGCGAKGNPAGNHLGEPEIRPIDQIRIYTAPQDKSVIQNKENKIQNNDRELLLPYSLFNIQSGIKITARNPTNNKPDKI